MEMRALKMSNQTTAADVILEKRPSVATGNHTLTFRHLVPSVEGV